MSVLTCMIVLLLVKEAGCVVEGTALLVLEGGLWVGWVGLGELGGLGEVEEVSE